MRHLIFTSRLKKEGSLRRSASFLTKWNFFGEMTQFWELKRKESCCVVTHWQSHASCRGDRSVAKWLEIVVNFCGEILFLNLFKDSFNLLKSPLMLLNFAPVMFFTGFQQTFCYAVFPTSVGNTLSLKNHDSALGSTQLVLGIGTIIGPFLTSICDRKSKFSVNWLILLFFGITMTLYYLCFGLTSNTLVEIYI